MRPARTTLVLAALVLPACGGASGQDKAVAELQALGDSGVTGTATFTAEAGKVRVEAEVSGLAPGPHGFHIHEWGDCSAADGKSAGAHYNPTGHEHGPPGAGVHAGDLGNLVADEDGEARVSIVLDQFQLDAGPRGILGRGLIVHADDDDLVSQPAGDAGGRVACGVIRGARGETVAVVSPG
jgi:Cu-Zn family superoxide dismutase